MMLKNSAGVTVWSSATPINLKGLASGSLTYKPALNVTGIPAGKYRMWFSVTDPSGYSAPMNIANVGRSADGEYPLGWISVR